MWCALCAGRDGKDGGERERRRDRERDGGGRGRFHATHVARPLAHFAHLAGRGLTTKAACFLMQALAFGRALGFPWQSPHRKAIAFLPASPSERHAGVFFSLRAPRHVRRHHMCFSCIARVALYPLPPVALFISLCQSTRRLSARLAVALLLSPLAGVPCRLRLPAFPTARRLAVLRRCVGTD